MSLPVSSSKTVVMAVLIIAMGKRRWERAFGVAFSWEKSAQARMAFWMGERCRVLLRVLFAGALSLSLFGGADCVTRWACCRRQRRGVVAWATLGAGATLRAGTTLRGERRGDVGVRKVNTRGENIVKGRRVCGAV